MADKEKSKEVAPKKSEAKGAPKKSGGGKIIFFMTLFGCIVPFGVPTLIVCTGFLPTLIVLFTEQDTRHPALMTIGYMNLSGVLPFIIELWQKGQTMEAALGIIYDPSTWVVMLGAAGIGQLILYVVPYIVTTMIVSKQESRRRVLRQGIQELKAIWGEDVINTIPVEIVRGKQGK